MTTLTGTIEAKGIAVRAKLSNEGADYISLTDIAKYKSEDANQTICNWMRLRDVIEYLGLWEKLNNPDFKPLEFEGFKAEAGRNAFLMSPKKWVTATNAIGIQSRSGRYGGTYAHSDIAFHFAAWLSPEFELYLIKDYQRLKKDESDRLSLDWSARREIAKTNYRIHTDAVKEFLIDETIPANLANRTYASEADIINMALFGMTAKEWREKHPEAPAPPHRRRIPAQIHSIHRQCQATGEKDARITHRELEAEEKEKERLSGKQWKSWRPWLQNAAMDKCGKLQASCQALMRQGVSHQEGEARQVTGK